MHPSAHMYTNTAKSETALNFTSFIKQVEAKPEWPRKKNSSQSAFGQEKRI